MIDKTTHPFIVNTLESSPMWSLEVRCYPAVWDCCMWFREEEDFQVAMSRAEGPTLADALGNLERLLETGSTKS